MFGNDGVLCDGGRRGKREKQRVLGYVIPGNRQILRVSEMHKRGEKRERGLMNSTKI